MASEIYPSSPHTVDDANEQNETSATSTVQVSLSKESQQLNALFEMVKRSSAIDNARVDEIKQALANKNYQIKSDNIAEKMLLIDGHSK